MCPCLYSQPKHALSEGRAVLCEAKALVRESGMKDEEFSEVGRMLRKYLLRALGGIPVLILFSPVAFAQLRESALRGQITDPSGAAIPAATVTLTDSNGATKQVQTNEQGQYVFQSLPAGTYTERVEAKGFVDFEKPGVVLEPGKPQIVDAQLQVAMEKQEVTVNDTTTRLSLSPENNASAVVVKGKDLEAFSDDPEDLQAELQALAGPAAGPNGGQIYIDGFTGGQLPPKSDILEVRANQNPFSAEYDKLGYGRIEITTRPGSSKFHGALFADGSDSTFNSRNPFVANQPPYHMGYAEASVGGPLGKKASFFLYGFRRDMQNTSIVNAIVLDPTLAQVPFRQAKLEPQNRTYLGPRGDFQLSSNNVMSVGYQFWQQSKYNLGIGEFALPSQGYNTRRTEHVIEVSDTQMISLRTVNQIKFQYKYGTEDDTSGTSLPAVVVLGAFSGGGNSLGRNLDTQNNYELQNLTSIAFGKHALVFGGRLRDGNETNNATKGYNGTFTFAGTSTLTAIAQYQAAQQTLQACAGQTPCQTSASQFSITAGNPIAKLNLLDLGLYAEDQWRARPNFSLSLGLRFETQNYIQDRADFAPRVGLAWGLGGGRNPRTVLRAGVGVFYDRFQAAEVLQAERLNGSNEQAFVVFSPCFFPNIPPVSALSTLTCGRAAPTRYQIDPALHAPYTIQEAVGVEQQIAPHITASVTYVNSHGVHQLLTRNINTPVPGTFDPTDPTSGLRPFGDAGNIFQYESDGLFNQNQIITNFNMRMGRKVSVFGYYTLSFADSNTGGPNSFPMNPYDLRADYGRAAFDIRHRLFVGGSFGLPYGFNLSPLAIANSGAPFNIILGQDLLGTSIFNDRPALAAPGAQGPGIIATSFGTFDTLPTPDEPLIPPYYGEGPGQFTLNLRLSKTFTFGNRSTHSAGRLGGRWPSRHEKGLGGQGLSTAAQGSSEEGTSQSRYSLQFSIETRNIFNFVNLGPPVGNLTSPIFGRSNSLAPSPFSSLSAPRRLDLQIRLSF